MDKTKWFTEKIIIITAPSGAGKTSITRYLLKKYPDKLAFSVSAATRQARGDEKDGVHYYFMSVAEFTNKIQHEEFVEWEMVYDGKYYGTLKAELQRIWSEGKNSCSWHRCKRRYSHTTAISRNYTFALYWTTQRRRVKAPLNEQGNRKRRVPKRKS